jgi:hypothetical protein
VLARLQSETGIASVEVDRRGELLRIHAGSAEDVRAVVDLLFEMGFAGEALAEGAAVADQWFGLDQVGELSREEAHVIARRVVPPFAVHTGDDVDALITVVATALHECFVTNILDGQQTHGALNSACGRAVEAATRPHLGDRATALRGAVETDLATRSAFKE